MKIRIRKTKQEQNSDEKKDGTQGETSEKDQSGTPGKQSDKEQGDTQDPSSDKKQDENNDHGQQSETEDREHFESVISIPEVKASPGEEVQVPVEISNNHGILGMILTVNYDESVCEMKSAENGDALKDVLLLTQSKTLKSGARFVWDGLELSEDQIKDGTVLMMKFKVSSDAQPGEYPITLTCAEGDVVNADLEAVSPQIVNGSLTVK